jgi:O-antigen/teichoic acid export membrane protein
MSETQNIGYKQKDFIINLILLIFLNLLIKPFWLLGIDLGVQNRVGPANYGLYAAIFSFTYLFNALLDMGITNFNNRNIARHTQLLQKHFSGILGLKMLLGVFYLVITFVVGMAIGYDHLQLKLLFWIAINQFLNAFILYLRSNISALLMFKTDALLSILDRLLIILICGILLWGNVLDKPFRIEWFVYSQTVAYLIAVAIAFTVVVYNSGFRKPNWNRTFFLMILKKSFPFALLYLLMSCYSRVDSVMIERLLGENAAYQTGIYASAFRLLDALVMISYLFSVILLPLFSKMLRNRENVIPIVKTSFSLLFYFSVTATVLLLIYRIPVLTWLYPEHPAETAQVFCFLMPCLIPISFTYIFGTLLTANKNLKLLNITSFVGIVLNFGMNFLLIPKLHAQGAAITSLTTQSIIALIQIFIAGRILNLSLRDFPLLRGLFYLLLFVSLSLITFNYLPINIWLQLLMLSIISLVLAFVTGLLSMVRTYFFKPFGICNEKITRSQQS